MSMDQQLNRRRIYFSDAEGVGPEEGRGGGGAGCVGGGGIPAFRQ